MKVGVIGTGWGLRLIESLVKMDVEPYLIYGHRNREHLTYLNFTEDVDEVFDECDAVITAVPPKLNFDMACKAGITNTHIFFEKPMAASLEEAIHIAEIVTNYEIIAMVGHGFCYSDNIHELDDIWITHAIGSIKRQPSTRRMNPYWNLAVHQIALFTLLKIETYFIQLILDKSFDTGGHIHTEFWSADGMRIPFPITGDYITNELKHFLDCCESGETPLTNAEHGLEVIKQLTERYGTIDQCLGG